jgi:hypothetical protein
MEQFAGVTISETISHPRLAAVYLRWVWFYLTVGFRAMAFDRSHRTRLDFSMVSRHDAARLSHGRAA